MPIFFQQDIDPNTRLAVWKIEEGEDFFLSAVPLQREITHPHKRLQHLAGRYLLRYLFADFPMHLIRIASTRKPFLENEAYHFSISHAGDHAAVIVSRDQRVGIDIELPSVTVGKIMHKFLHEEEKALLNDWPEASPLLPPTLFWSAKEAMFKWWGNGGIDFSEMLRLSKNGGEDDKLEGRFIKEETDVSFPVHYRLLPPLVLTWICTPLSNR